MITVSDIDGSFTALLKFSLMICIQNRQLSGMMFGNNIYKNLIQLEDFIIIRTDW